MARNLIRVILNEVKNLDLSMGSKKRDPSAAPQDDIATQSLEGEAAFVNFHSEVKSTNFYLREISRRSLFQRSMVSAYS
jgi:hypothetical protein